MSNTTNATKAPLAFTVLSNAIEQPRWLKVVSLFVIDYIASIITLILAIALRYAKFDFHTNILSIILLGALPVIFLAVTKFYSHVIRVFQDESMRWALVVLLGYLLISQILIFLGITPDIPRAATAIHVFLLYIWIWNSRIVLQFFISRTLHPEFYAQKKENVLIYGVGHITKDLMHVLHQTHQFKIVGIIDVNDNFIGARVLGVKVYPKDNLESLITDLEVNHVFFVLLFLILFQDFLYQHNHIYQNTIFMLLYILVHLVDTFHLDYQLSNTTMIHLALILLFYCQKRKKNQYYQQI